MDTDPRITLAPNVRPEAKTPWGAIIGILLILMIVVGGAYYALTDRLADMGMSETAAAAQ